MAKASPHVEHYGIPFDLRDPKQGLTYCLFLGLTAPNDKLSIEAGDAGASFAAELDDKQIEECKKTANALWLEHKEETND